MFVGMQKSLRAGNLSKQTRPSELGRDRMALQDAAVLWPQLPLTELLPAPNDKGKRRLLSLLYVFLLQRFSYVNDAVP